MNIRMHCVGRLAERKTEWSEKSIEAGAAQQEARVAEISLSADQLSCCTRSDHVLQQYEVLL
jgi:hypothetical protein